MKMISNVFSVIVCISSFLYTCYVLCNLTYFLSYHNDEHKNVRTVTDDKHIAQSTLWSLLVDMSLLSAFICQHSLMACELTKNVFSKLHVEYLNRSIYNICTSAVIHLFITQWQYTLAVFLWNIDTSNNDVLWLLFAGFHVFAWGIIYSGCLMMDISELCGLKQVWYRISGRDNPMNKKSRELKRYMTHMRHPSLTGFFIILWIHPFMCLDRLLLASILSLYMVLMWTTDFQDYDYHVKHFKRKQIELS